MNVSDIARHAWSEIEPDPTFIAELMMQLRARAIDGLGADELDHPRHPWIVAGAIAGVVGVGIAAFEVHRLRRRRAAA